MLYRPEQYDALIRRLVQGSDGAVPTAANPNMLVPYFLMGAYAYEELGTPFFTDAGWEWVCAELAAHWNEIEHDHKYLIDPDALSTGTASYLVGKLPLRTIYATKHLIGGHQAPSEIGRCGTIEMLPTPDLSDLLGFVAEVQQDIADLVGVPRPFLEQPKSSLADLL